MPEQTDIIKRASQYVFDLFKERLPEYLVYHTHSHSEMVAETARKIGKGMKLGEEGVEVVALAGWMHDLGYTEMYRGHEEISMKLATEFLESEGYPQEKIELVRGCIRATIVPQQPQNLLEEIVADADLSGLGRRSFFEKSELLRIEWEKSLGRIYTDEEWAAQNLDFLTGHRYFTRFAQEEYQRQREENIRLLHKKIRKTISPKDEAAIAKVEVQREKLARATEKDSKSEKSAEMVFRSLTQNYVAASESVDRKASVLFVANALVIASILTLTPWIFGEKLTVTLPICLLFCIVILSVLSLVPVMRTRSSGGFTSRESIENRQANLLSSANSFNMDLDEFQWGIREMISDKDFIYSSMIRESHERARIVEEKKNRLRLSYNLFCYGLLLCSLVFVIFRLSFFR